MYWTGAPINRAKLSSRILAFQISYRLDLSRVSPARRGGWAAPRARINILMVMRLSCQVALVKVVPPVLRLEVRFEWGQGQSRLDARPRP